MWSLRVTNLNYTELSHNSSFTVHSGAFKLIVLVLRPGVSLTPTALANSVSSLSRVSFSLLTNMFLHMLGSEVI